MSSIPSRAAVWLLFGIALWTFLPSVATAQSRPATTAPASAPTDEERATLARAGEQLNAGKHADAVKTLRDALKSNPKSRVLRLSLVRLYRELPEPDAKAALKLLKEAQEDDALKDDATWPREEAAILLDEGDGDAAKDRMRKAIALAPRDPQYRRDLLDVLVELKDYDAVLKEVDAARKAGVSAWWLHHQRGVALARQAKPDKPKALEEFDRAIAGAREESSARMGTLVAEVVLREIADAVGPDAALQRVREQLRADPELRWKLLLVEMMRKKGDHAEALRLAEAFASDPAYRQGESRTRVLSLLAIVNTTGPRPDYQKGLEVYKQLLELNPDDLGTLNNVAYLLADNFDPPRVKEAREYSQRAWEMSRRNGGYSTHLADTHGWILVLSGGQDIEEGIKVLEELVRREPDSAEPYYHLGEAHLRKAKPDPDAALKAFAKALASTEKRRAAGDDVEEGLDAKIRKATERAKQMAKPVE